MKNTIVGISCGHHESSVFFYNKETGNYLYLAEESVSRVKGDSKFPKFAIKYVEENNPELYSSVSTVVHFQKPLRNFLGSGIIDIEKLTKDHKLLKFRQFHSGDIFIKKEITKNFKNAKKIYYCSHHYSHVLTNIAFLPELGEGEKRLHLILDGYGDGSSGGVYLENNVNNKYNIEKIKSFHLQNSLGLMYSAVTEWAGFTPNEDEYKVMAIASFGSDTYSKIVDEICYFDKEKGEVIIDERFFNFKDISEKTYKEKFNEFFGDADVTNLVPELLWGSNLANVVAAFQRVLEKSIFSIIEFYINKIGINVNQKNALVCGGGVMHNSVLIGKLIEKYEQSVFVCPCPGDQGSSIGAANFGMLVDNNELISKLSPFVGPVAEDLNDYDHLFQKVGDVKESYQKILELLDADETIAIYSGKLEIGPRALGARSLICNGNSSKAVELLNEKRKKREAFRPIAPICNKKFLSQFIFPVNSESEIYNWMGAVIKMNSVKKIDNPSCVHHDNTIRVQTLMERKNENEPPSWDLIDELLKKYNFVGNTSFNIAGDPMVFLAEDVYINLHRLDLKYVYNHGILFYVKDLYDKSYN